jgi:hypothetical protein
VGLNFSGEIFDENISHTGNAKNVENERRK